MSNPLLLGHRGLRVSKLAPENTFAAFDLAIEHGCDGFEFDVRLAACGCAVVCHDPRIGKVSISRAKRDQLRKLPALEEVMRRYGQRVFLDIELKVTGLESKVLSALRDHPPSKDYVVSSFNPEVIMDVVARSGEAPVGIICETSRQLKRWSTLPVGYVIVEQGLAKRTLIEEIHAASRKVIVWAVNDARSMRRMAEFGVDAIVSDDTQLLVRTLRPGPGQGTDEKFHREKIA